MKETEMGGEKRLLKEDMNSHTNYLALLGYFKICGLLRRGVLLLFYSIKFAIFACRQTYINPSHISTTNRKKRLLFARAHQNWTVEDLPGLMGLDFC